MEHHMLKPLALSALLSLTACQQMAPRAPDEAMRSLKQTDTTLSKAISERNLESIVAFYADDAMLLPAAEPAVTGKGAIRAEWKHILAIPNFESTSSLSKAEVAASGDLGYTTGTYMAKMLDEHGKLATEPGKWVTVWKRQEDGRWLIAVETYNTDVPPPDHK